jgi:hypothetical protein
MVRCLPTGVGGHQAAPGSLLRGASGPQASSRSGVSRGCRYRVPPSARSIQRAGALNLLSMTAGAPRNSASRQGTLFGDGNAPQILRLAPYCGKVHSVVLRGLWPAVYHRSGAASPAPIALRHRKSAFLTIELRLRLVSCSFIDRRVNPEGNNVAFTYSDHLVDQARVKVEG